MTVTVEHGDMREVLARLVEEGARFQSIVTDPPYHLTSIVKRFSAAAQADDTKTSARSRSGADGYARLSTGFMGQKWDGGDIAFQPETWRLCYDLLPPGGYLLAFSGTRTYHRMAVAIEDAGFEIRDMIAWLYGTGFPKSHDVAKGIDKAAGAERKVISSEKVRDIRNGHGRGVGDGINAANRDGPVYMQRDITEPATELARHWAGWGTALKPALEPICFARKPLDGTVAGNVAKHGTGAINIDGCRVGVDSTKRTTGQRLSSKGRAGGGYGNGGHTPSDMRENGSDAGRWPANVVHDGSDEVAAAFPSTSSGAKAGGQYARESGVHDGGQRIDGASCFADSGSAARFFYSSKADAGDRLGSKHPTVKPVDLMRWLVRLVTPKGGRVLDPFAGSGTTGMACLAEGFDCTLIEREASYVEDIRRRIAHVHGDDTPLFGGGS